jgi:diguanylate cyclase (GGDEF)-like protein
MDKASELARRFLFAGDRVLGALGRAPILSLALGGVFVVGLVDYLTGHELSVSIFYLVPVAIAAWYAARRDAIGIALLCCLSWGIADAATGHIYEHPTVFFWNALVRLGFFLICGLLLTALRDSLVAARAMARSDPLTGLYTRRVLEARLAHDLDLCRRRGTSLSLAYVDLDNFKAVNDTHGHEQGDRVLRTAGRVLLEATRRADTVARLGGDEFVVIFPDTDRAGAEEVVAKLRGIFSTAFASSNLGVSCSIGVVTFQKTPADASTALRAADSLMYEAKRSGRNQAVFRVIGDTEPNAKAER